MLNTMMKKMTSLVALLALISLSTASLAADKRDDADKCKELAVDLADSADTNRLHDCNHEGESVSRYLSNYFKKGKKPVAKIAAGGQLQPVRSSEPEARSKNQVAPVATSAPSRPVEPASEPVLTITGEPVASGEDLTGSRFSLLQSIGERCPEGFNVKSESYEPNKRGEIALVLRYTCE